MFWETEKIISGNVKEPAQGFQILHARLIFAVFQIGNLALGHVEGVAQFGLIQFFFFTKKAEFFSKGHFHIQSPGIM